MLSSCNVIYDDDYDICNISGVAVSIRRINEVLDKEPKLIDGDLRQTLSLGVSRV